MRRSLPSNAVRKLPVDQQNDLTWRFPDRRFDQDHHLDVPGPAICTRCHAYLELDHWRYDEHRYRELKAQPDISEILCPGCTRVERRIYEGEVTVQHRGDQAEKQTMLHLIHNEEARARVNNPSARIALLEDRDGDDTIYVLTTTKFLAKRIGRELQKAFHGIIKVDELPQERFTRVRWRQGR